MKYLCIEDGHLRENPELKRFFTKNKVYINKESDRNILILVDNDGSNHRITKSNWISKFIPMKEHILPLGWYKLKAIV